MILLREDDHIINQWHQELVRLLPDILIQVYPDIKDPHAVEYALVWQLPIGEFKHYPNLKAIHSLGAGVDHLTCDPDLPNVPIIRLADPAMARDMAQYVLYWVMNFQRSYHCYRSNQPNRRWQRYPYRSAEAFSVGVLGMGQIGRRIYRTLESQGFNVSGWSRNPVADFKVSWGLESLDDFLKDIEVAIIVLPAYPQTQGMINQDFLKRMKAHSYLINVGRGALVVEQDLLNALDSGHIAGAALDVTAVEPLPADSSLWDKAFITPHISGMTQVASAAKVVADNIRRMQRGEQPYPLFNRHKGY